MNINLLENALEKNNVEEVERLITEISSHQHNEVVPVLIKHITLTEKPGIRNALAIALRDIGNEKMVSPLIDLINDPKTLGSRGTLLYALEPFNCTEHLETIVQQFLTGNFEVQAMAYQLLESMNGKVPADVLLKSLQKVKEQLNEIERQQELHTDVLDFLFNMNETY
ncbi:HEAT repeat domain-containing protein [Planomicrobium okeanokoites]|uniref:HEAT repeat domain-containing protein n=1 Tax=Planomicrobium okeanokoites TaxID=244 RepID=UPI002493AB60|nr:HEAT repeat domain-containing protein [Planomicrobium okeanokoites]